MGFDTTDFTMTASGYGATPAQIAAMTMAQQDFELLIAQGELNKVE